MAHRGGAVEHLENSMPAFEACVALGYRYLETDVRATADGVLVAFHDSHLERVSDRTGRLEQLPWSEVAQARIGGREPLVRLEDLLGAWPDVRFNLDIKAAGALAPLVRLVRRLKVVDRLCLASFSDARVAAARRLLGPSVWTSLGPGAWRRCGCRRTRRGPPAWSACRPAARRCRCTWAGGRWSTSVSSRRPTTAVCRSTCGPSTPRRRCRGCSTWGWTGS